MTTIQRLKVHQDEIFKGLDKRESDLNCYAKTIADLGKTNVAADVAYQRSFNGLYGVRRNAQWREVFFKILEDYKDQPDVNFRSVLNLLLESTGRVEASFASKLIATVNPTRAVYDSIVRKNLGIPSRSSSAANRIELLCADYKTIQMHHERQIEHDNFLFLRERFDKKFPQFTHFTDLKVLDLMIWQMRLSSA